MRYAIQPKAERRRDGIDERMLVSGPPSRFRPLFSPASSLSLPSVMSAALCVRARARACQTRGLNSPGPGNSWRIMSTVARTTVYYRAPRAIKNTFCIMQDNQAGTGLGQVCVCVCRRGAPRGPHLAARRKAPSAFHARESTCKLIIY